MERTCIRFSNVGNAVTQAGHTDVDAVEASDVGQKHNYGGHCS